MQTAEVTPQGEERMSPPASPGSRTGRPLSILMVADVDPVHVIGGGERMLHEHSTRLAARGHRVVVLTRRELSEYPAEEVHRGVRVFRHPVTEGGSLTFMRTVLRECGRAFTRLVAQERFDVVNVHQPLAGAGVAKLAQSRGLPILYTYLSPWGDEYRVRAERQAARASGGGGAARNAWVALNTRAREWMERSVLGRTAEIMVLSEFTSSQLRDIHGIPTSRPQLIPGGVDTERFRPPADRVALRRELGLPEGFLFLTVRNLVPRMGLDALIAAMAEVVRNRPDAHLAIGGSGALREVLEQQVRALGLERNVTFLGFIPEARLPDYYGAADLFVLPTRTLEGFGLVTVEALACGTPALGTPIGGTLEILRPFGTEWLFRGIEAGELAEGMLSRISQVEGEAGLRDRCRQYVLDHYAWEVIIPRVESLMAAMVNAENAGRRA